MLKSAAADAGDIADVRIKRRHDGFVAAQALLFRVLQFFQNTLVILRQHLDELRHEILPVGENLRGAFAFRIGLVPLHKFPDGFNFVLIGEFFEADHILVAVRGEVTGLVEHIGDAAAHARGEIASRPAEHEYPPAGHVFATVVANGLDDRRAVENIQRIHAARKHIKGIEVWAGAEVDILGDGRLDYPDEVLKQFDIVLVSVHSRMTMPQDEMTARLLRAFENPYVRLVGHPTGRQLLRRDPFLFDVEKVFDAAKQKGIVLEVNANPERLDLRDQHVRLARDRGLKIVISTDAHDPVHFKFMRYGVTTARRGWMEKSGVINTLPPDKLLASLRPLPK